MGAIEKDVTLSDGTIVHLDISNLRRKDWEDFWGGMENETVVLSRFTSLDVDQLREILDRDFQVLVREFINLRNKPLASPNSQSASI